MCNELTSLHKTPTSTWQCLELLEGLERFAPNLVVHRLPNAGHWVQNEVPDEVNRLLVQFFDGIKT